MRIAYKLLATAFAVLAFAQSRSAAQLSNTIKGVVTDTAGAPLAGALVQELPNGATVLTGGSGVFQLRSGAGSRRVVASHLGFRSDTIEITGKSPITIRLEPATLLLSPLIVAASLIVGWQHVLGAPAFCHGLLLRPLQQLHVLPE